MDPSRLPPLLLWPGFTALSMSEAAFKNFPDPVAALYEIHRVLMPGVVQRSPFASGQFANDGVSFELTLTKTSNSTLASPEHGRRPPP